MPLLALRKRAELMAALLMLASAEHAGADGLRAGQWKTVQSPEINGWPARPNRVSAA